MKKAMISQPMRGLAQEQIKATRNKAKAELEAKGYKVVNTLFDIDGEYMEKLGVKNVPLYSLAKSLQAMSHCDAVYFCKGWSGARGCSIEQEAAMAYGLDVFVQKDEE